MEEEDFWDDDFDADQIGDFGDDWEWDDHDMQEEEDLHEDGLEDERPGKLWSLFKANRTV